jgi:predicted CXXCH cytochrome family protein
MNTTCDATPSPLSLACLSCHDTAIGTFLGEPDYGGGAVSVENTHQLVNEQNLNGTSSHNCFGCHPDGGQFPGEWWQIGPDLSNDHPISMSYPTPAEDPDFNTPSDPQNGWQDVRLFGGRVECPSCHNPHDPTNVPFLRKTIDNSTICITCHVK